MPVGTRRDIRTLAVYLDSLTGSSIYFCLAAEQQAGGESRDRAYFSLNGTSADASIDEIKPQEAFVPQFCKFSLPCQVAGRIPQGRYWYQRKDRLWAKLNTPCGQNNWQLYVVDEDAFERVFDGESFSPLPAMTDVPYGLPQELREYATVFKSYTASAGDYNVRSGQLTPAFDALDGMYEIYVRDVQKAKDLGADPRRVPLWTTQLLASAMQSYGKRRHDRAKFAKSLQKTVRKMLVTTDALLWHTGLPTVAKPGVG
jgi:hypothetical protein